VELTYTHIRASVYFYVSNVVGNGMNLLIKMYFNTKQIFSHHKSCVFFFSPNRLFNKFQSTGYREGYGAKGINWQVRLGESYGRFPCLERWKETEKEPAHV